MTSTIEARIDKSIKKRGNKSPLSSTAAETLLLLTKQIERPIDSPTWFYNKVSGIMLEQYDTIKVEIEDWNKVVFDLVESIGYKNKKDEINNL